MTLQGDGAQRLEGALKPFLADLEQALSGLLSDEAGVRLHGVKALQPLLAERGCIGPIATSILGADAAAVRAILFNKTSGKNWSLAWHQDRTICVKEPRDVPGFGPWTIKRGMHHVVPPADLFSRMLTLRALIDDVPASNAPLLIAPGSHTFGQISENAIDEIVNRCGTRACIAEAGDVWLYSTPILHASGSASKPASRRVLQVDFAAESLPDGLEWLGV